MSKRNWYSIRAEGAGPAVIYMYGPIGYDWWTDSGTSAKEFARELDALGSRDVELRVNSEGGDVFEGYAIYSAIKRYAGRVTAYVDGLAASAASYLILAADEVVMGEASCLFIHQAWTMTLGNADELRATAEQLEVLDEQIVGIYAAHSDRDDDEIRATLKATKMFSAAEAVEWGFASRIDSGLKAAASITRDAAKRLFSDQVPDGIEVVDEVAPPASDASAIIDETPDEAPIAEVDGQEPVAKVEPQERPVARVVALRGRAQKFDTKG